MYPSMIDMNLAAMRLARRIENKGGAGTLVAIPRGGVPAALLIARHMDPQPAVTTVPEVQANGVSPKNGYVWFVDDIMVTGSAVAEARRQINAHGAAVFFARKETNNDDAFVLIDLWAEDWVVFPWEVNEPSGPEDAVVRLIEYAGDDPGREGLEDTPARVLRFLKEASEGYGEWTPTTFVTEHDDLVVLDGIPFGSLCEHHMLPYSGRAAVGYVPAGKLLGLSKLVRYIEEASRGLTMQEHVTRKAAEEIAEGAGTPSVAVFTTASHTCMTHRGVKAHGTEAKLSATLGRFRDDQALRAEFFAMIRT